MEIARAQYIKTEELNDKFWLSINIIRHTSEERGRIEMAKVLKDMVKHIEELREYYRIKGIEV